MKFYYAFIFILSWPISLLSGSVTFYGTGDVVGCTGGSPSVVVMGGEAIFGNLGVGGDTTICGNLSVSGDATIYGKVDTATINHTGAITVNTDWVYAPAATFDSATIQDNTTYVLEGDRTTQLLIDGVQRVIIYMTGKWSSPTATPLEIRNSSEVYVYNYYCLFSGNQGVTIRNCQNCVLDNFQIMDWVSGAVLCFDGSAHNTFNNGTCISSDSSAGVGINHADCIGCKNNNIYINGVKGSPGYTFEAKNSAHGVCFTNCVGENCNYLVAIASPDTMDGGTNNTFSNMVGMDCVVLYIEGPGCSNNSANISGNTIPAAALEAVRLIGNANSDITCRVSMDGTLAQLIRLDGCTGNVVKIVSPSTNTIINELNNPTNNVVIYDGPKDENSITTVSGSNNKILKLVRPFGDFTDTFYGCLAGASMPANSLAKNITSYGYKSLENVNGSDNTAVGAFALQANNTGTQNVAIGSMASASGVSGSSNVAIGYKALQKSFGSNNIAVGNLAGSALNSAELNDVYIGNEGVAGESNTIRLGSSANQTNCFVAGILNASGTNGVPVLIDSNHKLFSTGNIPSKITITDTTASTNCSNGALIVSGGVGIGGNVNVCGKIQGSNFNATEALCNLSVGDNANPLHGGTGVTAIGENALANTIGSVNTAVGCNALEENITGHSNVAVGYASLTNNINGTNNVSIGSRSLEDNLIGSSNVSIGVAAMLNSTSSNANIAIGVSALQNSLSNTVANTNIAIGQRSMQLFSIGTNNVAVGFETLLNGSGTNNVAIGTSAMRDASGPENVAIGRGAMQTAPSSDANVAIGRFTMLSCTKSSNNVAIGRGAMTSAAGSTDNVAIGNLAMQNNNNAIYNVAIGYHAMQLATGLQRSIAIGRNALVSNMSGVNNIAIGDLAGQNLAGNEINDIYIGNVGVAAEKGTIRIGTAGSQTGCYIAGIRGVTTTIVNAIPVLISSAGQLGTVSSSKRYKKDIQDIEDESEKMLQLRPVTFSYIHDDASHKQYGLIAEEVNDVYPELVVHQDDQAYTVNYMALIPLLLKQVQRLEIKLQEKDSMYENEIKKLYKEIEKNRKLINEILS